MILLSIIAGVLGGILVIVFIAAIGGFQIKMKNVSDAHPTCTSSYCVSWMLPSCGSGHCAHHCNMYCRPIGEDKPACIDPRPLPVGSPGHRPTVLKGGKSK